MIASPSDVQPERAIVREVVHEWNAAHSPTTKIVLLPVGWETHSTPLMGDRPQSIINWQVLKESDLLIAAFWTRLGTPTGKAASGTVEEIEEHVSTGKPALIYFSSAPVAPDSVDPEQYAALKQFKQSCQSRGLYATYDSTADFHNKMRQHLALTLNSHPYFEGLRQSAASFPATTTPLTPPGVPELTREAQELLREAVAGDGDVMVIHWMGGSAVQANKKNFVEGGNPRSQAIWEGAVQELVNEGLLDPVGYKGEIFRVTRRGYEVADLLKA
jgi:hypothetical protein